MSIRYVNFINATRVDPRHAQWLSSVEARVGLSELNPQPYWGFDDLYHKVGAKLHNCFLVEAETRKVDGQEEFRYSNLLMLRKISQEGLIRALENGHIFVDFDARSGHNHGTKFRILRKMLPELYAEVTPISLD